MQKTKYIPHPFSEHNEVLETRLEQKYEYDLYLVGKIVFAQNELRRFENFQSGCGILCLGVLAEKWATSCDCVRITLRVCKQLYELLCLLKAN